MVPSGVPQKMGCRDWPSSSSSFSSSSSCSIFSGSDEDQNQIEDEDEREPEEHPTASGLQPPALLLAGPTAVGKSEVAVVVAEKLGGEIISVDSMQVYRGLDIGTAKSGPAERSRVPHHLIDVAELTDSSFNAADFVRLAVTAMATIRARGRIPLLCGGTGLYFKALLEGIGDAPPPNAGLRAELEATPLADLLAELSRADPATYAHIDRRNLRRVLRAVEVIRLTGQPFSIRRAPWKRQHCAPGIRFFGLSRSTDDLRCRIEVRIDEMFRRGLVAETAGLLKRGLAENKTAMQALGYRQVVEYLQGERSLGETIELIKRRTRRFAKHQMTWFQRQLELEWIEIGLEEAPSAVADRLLRLWGSKSPDHKSSSSSSSES